MHMGVLYYIHKRGKDGTARNAGTEAAELMNS